MGILVTQNIYMRILLLLLSLSFIINVEAQKIKVSEIDKFTKARRIETSRVPIKAGFGKGFSFSFRSVDSTIFLNVSGYNVIKTGVTSGNKILLLLSTDTTLSIESKTLQYTDVNKYREAFDFEYYISLADVISLSRTELQSVRFSYGSTYQDIDIEKDARKRAADLAIVFLKEYNKQ